MDEGVNDPHIFKAVSRRWSPQWQEFCCQKILGGTGLRSINSDEVYEFLMKKQGSPILETIFSIPHKKSQTKQKVYPQA